MRPLQAIRHSITQHWAIISYRAGKRGVKRGATLPTTTIRLLGSSTKVEKGLKRAVLTAVLYLPPAHEAYTGVSQGGLATTCPWSTPECRAACLVDSGMLSMQGNARHWKETLRRGSPKLFRGLLSWEIASHKRVAVKQGKRPAVRLDGTSDLGLAKACAQQFPGVQFYDYTKSLQRATNPRPSNWHVTFSFSGRNRKQSIKVLAAGGNVAVVFQAKPPRGKFPGDPMPAKWEGFPVLNGDETDVRFDDAPGHVVGLSLKGIAQWDTRVKRAGIFAEPMPSRRLVVV